MKSVTDPRTGINFGLPGDWRLARAPLSAYCDPSTPQYSLLLSCERLPLDWLQGCALSEQARQLCAANPLAREVRLRCISEDRVLVCYRSGGVDQGKRKDDHHWLVLERGDSSLLIALLTLSVLADEAEPEQTAALVGFFEREAADIDFSEEAAPPIAGPLSSLQEKVDLLEDVTLSLCEGFCLALEGSPIDKQGLVAAALGVCLYWLGRWKAPFDEATKEEIGDILRLQVITGFCASLSPDSSRTRALFDELEPVMTRQVAAVFEPLDALFNGSARSDSGLERETIAFGLKLLLQVTTAFRDAPLEPEALTAQAERIHTLNRVVVAAPGLIEEAFGAEEVEEESLENSHGVFAQALLGAPLL